MEKAKGPSAIEGTCLLFELSIALAKVRDALAKRGATTIRGLGIAFRCVDSVDRNRKADREEFKTGLQDMGIALAKPELDVADRLFPCLGLGQLPGHRRRWDDQLRRVLDRRPSKRPNAQPVGKAQRTETGHH